MHTYQKQLCHKLKELDANLSWEKAWFDPRVFHTGLLWTKMAFGQVSLRFNCDLQLLVASICLSAKILYTFLVFPSKVHTKINNTLQI